MNLSYSSLELLHECPRKFELDKLLTSEGIGDGSLDLVCGKSLGTGIQSLFSHPSPNSSEALSAAVWEAYKAWTFPDRISLAKNRVEFIEHTRSICETNKKKAFFYLVHHLQKVQYTWRDKLEGWKIWTLPSGRPAIEVGFRIKLPNGSFHRGFIDGIITRGTGGAIEYAPLEIKTAGFENTNPALYQNSAQGNSYAFITDYITQRINPQTFYLVCEFPKCGQQVMDFWKGPSDKVSWLPALALDIQIIEMYKRAKHFPMNGKACFNYYRECKYLGVCNLSRSSEYIQQPEEDSSMYDYDFTLQQLLEIKDKLYG